MLKPYKSLLQICMGDQYHKYIDSDTTFESKPDYIWNTKVIKEIEQSQLKRWSNSKECDEIYNLCVVNIACGVIDRLNQRMKQFLINN